MFPCLEQLANVSEQFDFCSLISPLKSKISRKKKYFVSYLQAHQISVLELQTFKSFHFLLVSSCQVLTDENETTMVSASTIAVTYNREIFAFPNKSLALLSSVVVP